MVNPERPPTSPLHSRNINFKFEILKSLEWRCGQIANHWVYFLDYPDPNQIKYYHLYSYIIIDNVDNKPPYVIIYRSSIHGNQISNEDIKTFAESVLNLEIGREEVISSGGVDLVLNRYYFFGEGDSSNFFQASGNVYESIKLL